MIPTGCTALFTANKVKFNKQSKCHASGKSVREGGKIRERLGGERG